MIFFFRLISGLVFQSGFVEVNSKILGYIQSISTTSQLGVAALIKQKFRKFSPSAIASAFSLTYVLLDNKGDSILACLC